MVGTTSQSHARSRRPSRRAGTTSNARLGLRSGRRDRCLEQGLVVLLASSVQGSSIGDGLSDLTGSRSRSSYAWRQHLERNQSGTPQCGAFDRYGNDRRLEHVCEYLEPGRQVLGYPPTGQDPLRLAGYRSQLIGDPGVRDRDAFHRSGRALRTSWLQRLRDDRARVGRPTGSDLLSFTLTRKSILGSRRNQRVEPEEEANIAATSS
jgi:hypothetical protein